MDFEQHFKVYNLVFVQPKSIILGQMTNLNMIYLAYNKAKTFIDEKKLPSPKGLSQLKIYFVQNKAQHCDNSPYKKITQIRKWKAFYRTG